MNKETTTLRSLIPIYVFCTCILILIAGCSGSKELPAEAEEAFANWGANGISPERQFEYTVVSAQKATGDFDGDERWCVVTDAEILVYIMSKRYFLTRKELNWEVYAARRESEFLEMGCDNW